jgi:tRNA dimethylallyltransferase
MSSNFEAVFIAGPTASGKSALAVAAARELGAIVVNADSMQVYRDLRVITNRPSPEEESTVPHRLFGLVDGAVNFSAGRYMADAAALVTELRGSGTIPVFVGGTGLYFRALTEGLSDIPAVPQLYARASGRPRRAARRRPCTRSSRGRIRRWRLA